MEVIEKEHRSAVVGRETKSSICVVNASYVVDLDFEFELGNFEDHLLILILVRDSGRFCDRNHKRLIFFIPA